MSKALAKTLRPYQRDAEAAAHRMLAGHDSTLIVLPTGCGKTVVMAKLAVGWTDGNVLLLAHRIELLDQAADKIGAELGYRPPVEQGQRGVDLDCLWSGGQVIVGSVQTLCRERIAKFDRHPFGLVMIDEAHHATARSYRWIVDRLRKVNPALKVVGVTATPNRADDAALGIVFESVAANLPIWDAIQDGWLVPIEQQYVCIDGVDFSNVGVGKNDLGESDLKASELEDVLIEEEPLHALARPILDRSGARQALVFTCGVKHAHMLAAVLCRLRPDCARAVDGKTDAKERADANAAFMAGELQFLLNYGTHTEGFDAPNVGLIAMGRPTKSVGLYTQMAGRGTRPLPGVVDGPPTAELRRAAIAASAKPSVTILDFVGNSRHKLVSAIDVLGGNYDLEARALAAKRMAKKPGNVMDELRKAKAELALVREQKRRANIKAEVSYTTSAVDPFGDDAAPEAAAGPARGGCSDAQIGFLVQLGVPHAEACAFGKAQAGAVITSLKAKRCTQKQKAVLAKYGEPTDVPFAEASARIDAIAKNGWKPLRREVAHA